jgi:AraC-like DNA-binding protein
MFVIMKRKPEREESGFLNRSLGLSEKRPIDIMNQSGVHDDGARHYDMHYELEMGVILEGSMERYTRDSSRVLQAGDIWFTGIWEPHGFRCDGDCHRVVFVIWPPALTGFHLPEAPKMNLMQPFLLPQERRPVMPHELRQEIIALTRHHISCGRNISPARKRLFATELLVWLFDKGLVRQSSSEAPKEQMISIAPVIEMVFSNKRFITNEEAARVCGLSRDIFIRTFRKLMGVSFRQFAVRYRLSGAATLLRQGELPVKAIAQEWGFTDESHLHRHFIQHYGCPPLAYRQYKK